MKSAYCHACLLLALLLPGLSTAQASHPENTKNKKTNMSVLQANKETVRSVYERSLNEKNFALLHELVSEDFTGPGGKKGADGFQEPVAPLIQAFPNIRWHIEELLAEEDKVFVRWTLQGTQTAAFRSLAATGKTVANEGSAVYTLKNGKITGSWVLTDRLGFLQALDILPTDINTLYRAHSGKGLVSFIDKFTVPASARDTFYERVRINRALISKLPGFVTDAAYEYTDDKGNLFFVTVAQWESKEALDKARETVQAEYRRQGFNLAEMLQKQNITVDRGIYTAVPEQR